MEKKGGIVIKEKKKTGWEKMQAVADEILEKVRQRVTLEEPETMSPQSMRHLTGVLKDLKDIQMPREQQEKSTVTVCISAELEEFCE